MEKINFKYICKYILKSTPSGRNLQPCFNLTVVPLGHFLVVNFLVGNHLN